MWFVVKSIRKVVEIEEGANDFDGRTKQLFQMTCLLDLRGNNFTAASVCRGIGGKCEKRKKYSACQLCVARVCCLDCTCACGSNNIIK